MGVKLEDRPIEQVREEVVDKLIFNYSHGVISSEAFERRLDDAMKSTVHQEIVDLAADLQMEVDEKYSATKEYQFTPNYDAPNEDNELTIKSILGSETHSGRWLVPQNIKALNVLGSITLDFTDAVFQHQTVVIDIDMYLGSTDIYIPENVNVVCKTSGFMNSTENRSPSMAPKQAPTIIIKGVSVMGTLEIKVKRTVKEKFMSFAEQLKSAFNTDSLK